MAAKFTKKKDIVEMSGVSQKQILDIIKTNIPCKMVFYKDSQMIDYLEIGVRSYKGNESAINIHTTAGDLVLNYREVVELISGKMELGIPTIEIAVNVFKEKEPLIVLLGMLKKAFTDTCVYIDYDNGIFSILNQPLKDGSADKLYYFEENNSVLVFSVNGPKLIYNKWQSVEDLFCD